MKSLNRCEFIGRLGKDPEIKYTANNDPVAKISLAVSNSYNDKDGQRQEQTEWIPIVIFGKLAEVVGNYVKKGSLLYIAGEFKTRKWQDNNGQDRYTTEVVVNGFDGKMQMLDTNTDKTTDKTSTNTSAHKESNTDTLRQNARQYQAQKPPGHADNLGNNFDEIPF